jgi:hypothetical protein
MVDGEGDDLLPWRFDYSFAPFMPRNKRPLPRKSNNTPPPSPDAHIRELSTLALTIVERGESGTEREEELVMLVRRALRRKHDEVLYGAVEDAKYTDPDACRLLRGHIEEEAASQRIRREGAPELEIDAFLVPLFVRSRGGLVEDEALADDAAFEELVQSFKRGGLESPDASVVLVRHLYDWSEIDQVSYCELHEIVREAAASMTSKKPAQVPLLAATMRGWSTEQFDPEDEAMELRFLLGFSLKRADDPFYAVPADEEGSDAYFDARMERYRAWTVDAAPLVQRCLARDPARVSVDFLYQDLFFGAREEALSEVTMLAVLTAVNEVLEERGAEPAQVRAVVAAMDAGEQAVLRLNLYRDGELLGSFDKEVDLAADIWTELDDLCEALGTLGVAGIETAAGFDEDGQPEGAQVYGEE